MFSIKADWYFIFQMLKFPYGTILDAVKLSPFRPKFIPCLEASTSLQKLSQDRPFPSEKIWKLWKIDIASIHISPFVSWISLQRKEFGASNVQLFLLKKSFLLIISAFLFVTLSMHPPALCVQFYFHLFFSQNISVIVIDQSFIPYNFSQVI